MANGYEKGDYLAQFLNQLPQIYRAKQNIDLQRERLQYMKEEGFKDELYRAQVLTANEQTNKLARQAFEEKQQQNIHTQKQREFNNEMTTKSHDRADFKLEASVFEPGTKAYNTWVLNSKMVKEAGPVVENQIRETFEIEDDLTDRLRATMAMTPLAGLEEVRKISLDTNLNDGHFELIQTLEKKFLEAAEVTQAELAMQPSYKNLENERILLQEAREKGPRATQKGLESMDAYRKRVEGIRLNVESYEKDVMEEARSAQGVYPGLSIPFYEKYEFKVPMYDNIEDIPETEVDEALSVLGAPAIESNVLPPEFAPPTTPTTPTPTPITVESEVPSAYTGSDVRQKGEVDFLFGLLKDGKISKKRFWEGLKKANVNVQSIDLSMVYKHKGKAAKKELSVRDETNISRSLRRIEKINEMKYTQEDKQKRIDKIKEQILAIDPNYKFKN